MLKRYQQELAGKDWVTVHEGLEVQKLAGPAGDEVVLEELGRIKLVDVILPTRCGQVIRRACVSRPDDHQAILLHRLGLTLPTHLQTLGCSEDF